MDTGQSLDGMAGLTSHEEQLAAEAEKNRPLTRWERKKKRILIIFNFVINDNTKFYNFSRKIT